MNQLVTEKIDKEIYHYYPLGKYVVRAPSVCGGRPTFKYTRIEISVILAQLAKGFSVDEIVYEYYERISKEAILEAIELVTKSYVDNLPRLKAV